MGYFANREDKAYFIEGDKVYANEYKTIQLAIDPVTLEYSPEIEEKLKKEPQVEEKPIVIGGPTEEKPGINLSSIIGNSAIANLETPEKPVVTPAIAKAKEVEKEVEQKEDDGPKKHNCKTKGRGGRFSPEGECPRCDQLRGRK